MDILQLYNLYQQSTGICTDTRSISEGNLFFALKGANFNANTLAKEAIQKGAIAAVIDDKNYKENEQYVLVDDCLVALQKLAHHHREQFKIPIIGITGTNGKTTTKELIAAALSSHFKTHFTKGNLNNHIGVPLILLSMPKDTEIAIIEMGANKPGDIAELCEIANPNYGIITNIGKAHLEGLGSLEGVAKTKSELYLHVLKHGKTIFVNSNDEHLMRMASRFENPITFPKKTDFYYCDLVGASPYLHIKTLRGIFKTELTGSYNFPNIAAALCISNFFGVPQEKAEKALSEYVPQNNRSQIIKKDSNIIILDAYNANPSSMKAAIESAILINIPKKIFILGDMFELGKSSEEEHSKIGEICNALKNEVSSIILCGKEMEHAKNSCPSAEYFETKAELEKWMSGKTFANTTFLIKGSRGMALEGIVNFIN